jgi:hypothetical protein
MKKRVKDPSFAPKGLRRAGGIPKRARRFAPCRTRVVTLPSSLRYAGQVASGGFSSLMGILGLWVFRNILRVMKKQ